MSILVDAVVVGSGWAGIWTLHSLRKAGFNVLLVEAKDDVGGVWKYINYPGCRNDIAVPMWQFAAKETWTDWNWTERYPLRAELGEYFKHVCDKLDVKRHMVFNTKVTKARWEETDQRWYIYSGSRLLAISQYFIPCTGYVTTKYIPEIKGLSSFSVAHHTCDWPDNITLKDKRIGVIGTGASGLQVIEEVASIASHLTVFQRTPNLATPRYQEAMSPESNAVEKKAYPSRFANRMTYSGYDTVEFLDRDTESDSVAKREAVYESLWAKSGTSFWFGNYRDMLTSPTANASAYAFWRSKVLPRIKNPSHAAILAPETPRHPFGTKRPSLEEHYFEVFNQLNVTLVDLPSDAILEVTPTSVITATSGVHELDVLVLATGYDFVVGSLLAIDIRGRENLSLRKKWSLSSSPISSPSSDDGIATHLGLATHDFPNLFFPIGPQAPTSFALTPLLVEIQASFLTSLLLHARSLDCAGATIEATQAAEQQWTRDVAEAADATLIPTAETWYMAANIPGRKREPLCWFGGVGEYVRRLEKCRAEGFEGWVVTAGDDEEVKR